MFKKNIIRFFSTKTFFTKSHEWIKVNLKNKTGLIGISDYAQNELGDIVIVEFPDVNQTFKKGESFAIIESTKSTSDLYAPIDLEIININEELENDYSVINQEAEDNHILEFKYETLDEENLLSKEDYEKYIEEI